MASPREGTSLLLSAEWMENPPPAVYTAEEPAENGAADEGDTG